MHPRVRARDVRRIHAATGAADELAVVAEEIHAVRAGLEGDGGLTRVARAMGGHNGPLLGREQLANVGGAAIRAAVEHPENAALIRACALGKGHDHIQPLAVDGGFHQGRRQQFFAPEFTLLFTVELRLTLWIPLFRDCRLYKFFKKSIFAATNNLILCNADNF